MTGSITKISIGIRLSGRARDGRLRARVLGRFRKVSVPRSLRTSRSARSADIFGSVHWLDYVLGEAERIARQAPVFTFFYSQMKEMGGMEEALF